VEWAVITEERSLDQGAVRPVDPDDHLERILNPEFEEPWFRGAVRNIKEFFNPPKLPPLEVTSKPAEVQDIWKTYDIAPKRSGLYSAGSTIGIHILAIVLLFVIFRNTPAAKILRKMEILYSPPLKTYTPPQKEIQGGGGGGGAKQPTPVSKGAPPKFAPKQFQPPALAVPKPQLPLAPTITAEAPKLNMDQYGSSVSSNLITSLGQGIGGMGNGSGGGVGDGRGNGFGPGTGGGMGGGVYRIGGGVSAPMVLSKAEPEYSEEARKAKFQGTVVLMIIVDDKGLPQNIRVVRPLGLGLDEKAIEAVQKWRFRPAMKDGRPVKVEATVEVNFRLL
jgi:TonB family protein